MQRSHACRTARGPHASSWWSSLKSGVCAAAVAACASVVALSSIAHADVGEGERAYAQGRKDEAIRLLRRAAWQENDFYAQLRLGDIYSAKRPDDNGYKDPVEAFVWYFLAGHNPNIVSHFHLDETAAAVIDRLVKAEQDSDAIYANLLQDERIDVRNRVTYIEACRGGEGMIMLGQLHDPGINSRHTGEYYGRPSSLPRPIVRPFGDRNYRPTFGGGSSTSGASGYGGSSSSSGYPSYGGYGSSSSSSYGSSSYGSSDYGSSSDAWPMKLCRESDWWGWLFSDPYSCRSTASNGESRTTVFPSSGIEALVYYQLADRAGHPLAKTYIDTLKAFQSYNATTDQPNGASDTLAKAKAARWLAPFEFYAAETRYRGETPSGLVHSDECPVGNGRARALALGQQLIPQASRRDMLAFLGFARGGDYSRAISKYQDFLGDAQTGDLTAVQLTRLFQIAAVRGYVRGQRCLGVMYVKGIGVVQDFVRGEKWLLAAAEQGDGEAMYALSELYTQGADGIDKSEDKATRYRQGSAVAGFNPTRAEFLRLLETAPRAADPENRPRRRYRRPEGGPDDDAGE